jgi:tetratricopeptide (TPR) repeat protein
MSRPVFISYARSASGAEARALADSLGDLAFFDTEVIEDGDHFPQQLLEGILGARVVVIFATKNYIERRFCRLEMRLAMAGCDAGAEQVVVALGDGANAVLDGLPAAVADQNWPPAGERERLADLVRERLERAIPIRDRLAEEEARKLAVVFLEESKTPELRSLQDILCSLPPGVAAQSIGTRFVGRADALRRIHRTLWEGGVAQLTSRISAGGGFGKTRLASEYVHRYGASYYPGGVFWVNASSKSLDTEFWRVLSAINEKTPDLATLRAQRRDIKRELERALRGIGKPTLYVVDDIPEAGPGEDPASIGEFCPALGAVTVLATSRQDTWEANVRTIPVQTLGREAAILLLTENVPGTGALRWEEWGRIATWVGHLPLFLDLLNRSLALNSISPRELMQRADRVEPQRRTAELDSLREALRGQVPGGAVRGVTEAFSISFEKLEDAAKEAAKMLGQLAATPIPEALFEALPEEWKAPGIRAALRSRHFVTSGGGLSFGVMHRMMADFLRTIAAEEEQDLLVAACRALLKIMTPDRCGDPGEWALMSLCRPHAEVLVERGLKCDASATVSSELGMATAILASAQGDYAGARRLEEQVLEVRTRVLGKEHPNTLSSMSNLATTLSAQGDYAGARWLQEQVLEVSTRVLGKEHPGTLTSMSNLALILRAQGNHAGARRLHEQVLEVRTRVLGKEHPDTLTSMNNLAVTLGVQGDHAGARRLQEQVLEMRARVLGKEHPNTLTSMSNLAETYRAQGDHAGARRLQEQLLEVRTRVFGKEHPATLTSMNNLAETHRAQGDYAGARRLEEQVLEASTRVLGKNHPHTLASMGNLALILNAQGDHAGARRLEEQVMEVRTQLLGKEHPDTLTTMGNLAVTLREQRDHASARQLQEQVLEISTQVLGKEHPDTLTSMSNLALIHRAEGNHAGARRLHEQVLEVRTRVLGKEHPATLTSMWNLAFTLLDVGERTEALQMLRKCLDGQRRVLGDQHPDTMATAKFITQFQN